MSFRLVPNSVTLDDLSVISPNSVDFGTDCVKVVDDTPIYFVQRKCMSKNLVFSDILFMPILAGDHPGESVKVTHSPLASENVTNNQP